MKDRLEDDIQQKAGARDYQDVNGEFPPNHFPVPTSGGKRSDIDEENLDAPGASTTHRRGVDSKELEKHLSEYDKSREQGRLTARSRRSADGLSLV